MASLKFTCCRLGKMDFLNFLLTTNSKDRTFVLTKDLGVKKISVCFSCSMNEADAVGNYSWIFLSLYLLNMILFSHDIRLVKGSSVINIGALSRYDELFVITFSFLTRCCAYAEINASQWVQGVPRDLNTVRTSCKRPLSQATATTFWGWRRFFFVLTSLSDHSTYGLISMFAVCSPDNATQSIRRTFNESMEPLLYTHTQNAPLGLTKRYQTNFTRCALKIFFWLFFEALH